MRCTTLRLSGFPVERSETVPRSQGCFRASLAVGRLAGSLLSSCATKSLPSSLMPSQQLRLKFSLSSKIDCLQRRKSPCLRNCLLR